MNIEDLAIDDFDDILDIYNESRSHTDGMPSLAISLEELKKQVQGETIQIARISGIAVGFVSIWSQDNFVHHLYIRPQYQSRGIGTMLLRKCQDRFGLPLRLKCLKSNLEACKYYENAGWIEESEDVGPDGPYIAYRLGDA